MRPSSCVGLPVMLKWVKNFLVNVDSLINAVCPV
jgi:hypothetical protein